MIFLTVGTQFSFDRLVQAVDELAGQNELGEEIFAQIGDSSYKPRNFKYVQFLAKESFDDCIKRASRIISHAGMGTITMALDIAKPLLVMPRLKKYHEVVNDHQVAIAEKFEKLGYILAVYKEENLAGKIEVLKSFVPRPRENQAWTVAARISEFLQEIQKSRKL